MQKTVCYELSRNDLKEALGEKYIDVILFCFFKACVEKNNFLKTIFIESQLNDLFNVSNKPSQNQIQPKKMKKYIIQEVKIN